ncbi:MAG TPA: RDD family protein [Mucilaginibacter sp.]|nr:RDD family protein [Mucilaginibacter sp.]
MAGGYYILINGAKTGPYQLEELIRMELAIDSRVLSPVAGNWEDACNVPELYGHFYSRGIYFPAKSNLASFWWRLMAYAIDFVLIEVTTYLALNQLALKGVINSRSLADMFLAFVVFQAVLLLYNAICEATPMKGSPGKRICGLVVVDIDGYGQSFLNSVKRNFYKIISRAGFYLGFLRVFWDEHRQAWHDEFAGTYVIKRRRA